MDANVIREMFSGVDHEYINILAVKNKSLLERALKQMNAAVGGDLSKLTPEPRNIFRAFKICKYAKLKVVIIGQDPYPKRGDADGMAFASNAFRHPHSLRNILKCLASKKLISKIPDHSNLDSWAEQGVLLLNASLTTEVGKSNAHKDIWDEFTDAVVKDLVSAKPSIVMMLWGKEAQSKGSVVEHENTLTWGHPSPLAAANRSPDNPANFLHCDNFQKCNEILLRQNETPINWDSINNVLLQKPLRQCVIVAGDGAARGNGKRGCRASWAFCVYESGHVVHSASGEVESSDTNPATNNRGELQALKNALEYVETRYPDHDVCVLSDSEYSLNTISDWAPKWFANPVRRELDKKKNLDIIRPVVDCIDRISMTRRVLFEHVNGHQDEPPKSDPNWTKWYLNDLCDKMCQEVLDGKKQHAA
jgi:uracil-DNA glycosylase